MSTLRQFWLNLTSVQVSGNNNVVNQSTVRGLKPPYPEEVLEMLNSVIEASRKPRGVGISVEDDSEKVKWFCIGLLRQWDHTRGKET